MSSSNPKVNKVIKFILKIMSKIWELLFNEKCDENISSLIRNGDVFTFAILLSRQLNAVLTSSRYEM